MNTSPANSHQVGGRHYASAYQHWDWVVATNQSYLTGNATRYISRWRKKNGLEDLQKALHYIDKQIECVGDEKALPPAENWALTKRFCQENELDVYPEHQALMTLATWRNKRDLQTAREYVLALVRDEQSGVVRDGEVDIPPAEPVPLTEENKHADRVGEADDGTLQSC